jgi:hypothetical protein
MGFRVFRPSDLCVWTSHAVRRLAGDALVFGRSPETRGRAFVRRERHVVAVIDVVGFTARAAGHAASGIDGIEAIAHEVNACFGLLAAMCCASWATPSSWRSQTRSRATRRPSRCA